MHAIIQPEQTVLAINFHCNGQHTLRAARRCSLQPSFEHVRRVAQDPCRHAGDASCHHKTRRSAGTTILDSTTTEIFDTKLTLQILVQAKVKGETREVPQQHALIALQEAYWALNPVYSLDLVNISDLRSLVELRSHFEQVEHERDIGVIKAGDRTRKRISLINSDVLKLVKIP